jgi:hypothetical protein
LPFLPPYFSFFLGGEELMAALLSIWSAMMAGAQATVSESLVLE